MKHYNTKSEYTSSNSKESAFKIGCKITSIPQGDDMSSMGYPDTEESIRVAQQDSVKKVKGSMSQTGANQRH
jgi:hypothetical protein